MNSSLSRRWSNYCMALLAFMMLAVYGAQANGGDITQRAVDRAQRFLDPEKRGKFVTSYIHFGSTYNDHTATKIVGVTNSAGKTIPGHFALVYKFEWDGDGWTNVAFFFDEDGDFYQVKALDTNAIINQPFLKADLSIAILGNIILELLKDQMTADQLREAKRFIDSGNSKGLLEMALQLQQKLGT